MKEFAIIKHFYGDRWAKRSGVLLINHITEGLFILDFIGASELAKRAFCIHPIVQSDKDLLENLQTLESIDGRVIALAMEYRRVANAYLSTRVISNISEIELSPLKEVNDMLIADKVQNRKDFNLHHSGSHPRSAELDAYFKNWFLKLNIDESLMALLIARGKT